MDLKGIVYAAGSNEYFGPGAHSLPLGLLTVYDRPMILLSLVTLREAGIKNVVIITKTAQLVKFQKLIEKINIDGLEISWSTDDSENEIQALKYTENLKNWRCIFIRDEVLLLGSGSRQALKNVCESTAKLVIAKYKTWLPNNQFNHLEPPFYGFDYNHLEQLISSSKDGEARLAAIFESDVVEEIILDINDTIIRANTPESILNAAEYIEVVQERRGRQVLSL